ncbi:hypothetical protein CSKR_114342 [Clonorchis sinensis]|uniref:Uncharacterized protein n=1 Tax=Clonorchis sinensis TaxID=79923 RepID=A0A3R7FNI0_CLOSI|nr:hypothetical protein CSKR_114342 [Clonorchis sinensis]
MAVMQRKGVTAERLFFVQAYCTNHKRNTLICEQICFCERLAWNPAESLVCDVFRQLNVLHQSASCSSCYDIRDIAIHVYT